jgi:lysophospholipase L1-like esterase
MSQAVPAAPAEIEPISAPFDMPQFERPVFPDRQFNITDFGAKEGGEVKNTDAIKAAIEACSEAGGGHVIVPEGKWLTGKVHLKSNIDLHLDHGAELIFSDDPADYLPAVHTTWEGLECFNYSPLIYAYECENIGITGKGKLICNQYQWRRWMSRPEPHMNGLKELYEMAAKGVPVKERNMVRDNINLRPQFIQPNRCKNVLIEDVTIRNSPFWTVHPVLCENVIIRGLDVQCRGHNTDGVDPEFCKNVLIEYCKFDQGDDPIVIKAGRNQDAWRLGKCSKNIIIRHCEVILGHNLLAIGSEMSGGVRNVYMYDCDYKPYEGFVRSCVLIKTNHRRGGFVENIFVDNIRFAGEKPGKALLEIDTDVLYQWRDLVPTYETRYTKIGNINLTNIAVNKAEYGLWINGAKEAPIRGITLDNVTVGEITKQARYIKNAEDIRETNVAFGAKETGSVYRQRFDFASEDARKLLTGDAIEIGEIESASGDKCGFVASEKPFYFDVEVPEEGNYRVTVTLGGAKASRCFVKAESRRLMLEDIKVGAGQTRTLDFLVNIRNSVISEGRSVKLNSREKEPACRHWDNSLTLEFNGENPSVCAVEIVKDDSAPTIFLAGDSTVTDQYKEPWTSWGQMFTRMFTSDVAVANYAESGRTFGSFKGDRRFEKLLSQMKAGDYLFVQFAHNDMKRGTPEEVGYAGDIKLFTEEARKRGANPVMVTSMHRRRFDADGKVIDTLAGFPEAMKAAAEELNVPVIDLHAMSREFYEALGPSESAKAFQDGTHHNAYGAYELAKCVAEGIKEQVPLLAAYLDKSVPAFDPAKPDNADDFYMPASPAIDISAVPEGN